jgi:putative acetyltransferase
VGIGAKGRCLVGHPDDYTKIGFENPPGLVLEGGLLEVSFSLSFDGHTPRGSAAFHEGFKADGGQSGAGDSPKFS